MDQNAPDRADPGTSRPATPVEQAAPGPGLPVPLRRLHAAAQVPAYAHPGDAGADLHTSVDVLLAPGERQTVPTGVAIALPAGYAAFVHPRSGLADRHGLTVVNAPGTVDAGYRGEIRVTLLNTDRRLAVQLRRGDRIAQLVVQPVATVQFVEVTRLPEAVRGEAGFGSTGGFATGSDPEPDSAAGQEHALIPGGPGERTEQ